MARKSNDILLVAACLLVALSGSPGCRREKVAHETTATVRRFEHVVFQDGQKSYRDDEGRERPVLNRDQWRIYYSIDDFNQLSPSDRAATTAAEAKRESVFGPRFWYDVRPEIIGVREGQKISVLYRYAGDGHIEVLSVSRKTAGDESRSDLRR